MPEKIIKCKQAGCTASTDGKCLEGLELEVCPHCSIVEDEIIEEIILTDTEENNKIPEKESFYNVHIGEALKLNETNKITSSSLTRLILLAGLIDAGKTTMLASIFDLFQCQNNLSGYTFAGSQTLIGFERRCHDARIKSEREIPVTERTKRSDSNVFLHLKVQSRNEIITNLLFTDLSGEIFIALSDSTEECRKFELAKRADHFALFIDADQLSNLEQRNIVKARSIGILSSLIETKMLNKNTHIEIIFSKWDMLIEKQQVEIHLEFVEGLKVEINKKISSTHPNLEFYKLASRPVDQNKFEFGYGISEIFTMWVENSQFKCSSRTDNTFQKTNKIIREFSKFKFA